MSRNGLKPLHRGDVRTDARTHARARARPPTCGGIRDIRSEPVGGRGEKHLAKHDLSSALRLLHQRQHLNSANTHSKRLHPSRWPRADGVRTSAATSLASAATEPIHRVLSGIKAQYLAVRTSVHQCRLPHAPCRAKAEAPTRARTRHAHGRVSGPVVIDN